MSGVVAKVLINSKYAATGVSIEYTTPASTKTIIDKFSATNIDASARTITVHLVPSGGSADGSNKITSAFSISAGAAVELSELKNQILAAGDTIQVSASAGSAVVTRCSGREVS